MSAVINEAEEFEHFDNADEVFDKVDEDGNPIIDEEGEKEQEEKISYIEILDAPRDLPEAVALTFDHLKQIGYELGLIKLCWPEVIQHIFEDRSNFPIKYLKNNEKEKAILLYAENFRQQFCDNPPNHHPSASRSPLACWGPRRTPRPKEPTSARPASPHVPTVPIRGGAARREEEYGNIDISQARDGLGACPLAVYERRLWTCMTRKAVANLSHDVFARTDIIDNAPAYQRPADSRFNDPSSFRTSPPPLFQAQTFMTRRRMFTTNEKNITRKAAAVREGAGDLRRVVISPCPWAHVTTRPLCPLFGSHQLFEHVIVIPVVRRESWAA
ncbi:unnamed protein product [Phaedon cochleariae]|uniref:Uncharacterized protein n=1 Tax=Phaedon cochleariae TaxID=80249 RepID=A0A9N9SKW2_PHACE|nr:unnamed protein product [Phaedon cochleariae]